jgi:hypothetical protein
MVRSLPNKTLLHKSESAGSELQNTAAITLKPRRIISHHRKKSLFIHVDVPERSLFRDKEFFALNADFWIFSSSG